MRMLTIYHDGVKFLTGIDYFNADKSLLKAYEVTDEFSPEYYYLDSDGKLCCTFEILKFIKNAELEVQKKLNIFAQNKGYDSIVSACSYATSTISTFATEAQFAINMRDTIWLNCYSIFENIKNHKREIPTIQEFEAELPAMLWPDEPV